MYVLDKYGKADRPKNRHGIGFVELLIHTGLLRLVGQVERKEGELRHAFSSPANKTVTSVIDTICISKRMRKASQLAKILPLTRTGKETHELILADVTLHRAKEQKLKVQQKRQSQAT